MALVERVLPWMMSLMHHSGYTILLISTFLESVPILGLAVPGQTMVILGGFFAKLGVLDFETVVLVSASAAVLGDLMGYAVGKRYGQGILEVYTRVFPSTRQYTLWAKSLVRMHVGFAFIIGRFSSAIRCMTPFVAGIDRVRFHKVLVSSIVGGFCWATAFGFVGYMFGHSYQLAARHLDELSLATVFGALLLLSLLRFAHKRKRILKSHHKKKSYLYAPPSDRRHAMQ